MSEIKKNIGQVNTTNYGELAFNDNVEHLKRIDALEYNTKTFSSRIASLEETYQPNKFPDMDGNNLTPSNAFNWRKKLTVESWKPIEVASTDISAGTISFSLVDIVPGYESGRCYEVIFQAFSYSTTINTTYIYSDIYGCRAEPFYTMNNTPNSRVSSFIGMLPLLENIYMKKNNKLSECHFVLLGYRRVV